MQKQQQMVTVDHLLRGTYLYLDEFDSKWNEPDLT